MEAPRHVSVVDHKHLVRDTESKAVLTIDGDALDKYRAERERQLKITAVSRENAELKEELASIKELLTQLLNGKKCQ